MMYIFITATDIVATLSVFPMATSFFKHRDPALFGIAGVCYTWGFFWAKIPFFSVFLVATISITRTFSLAFPLRNINPRNVVFVVSGYFLYLSLSNLIPLLAKYGKFVFTYEDMYCWEETKEGWYQIFDMLQGAILLAVPIIPILISCFISVYFIAKSFWMTKTVEYAAKCKLQATITIVIVTAVYVICNLPIFVVWTVYFHDGLTIRQTVFWKYYSWGCSYVILVAINATVNPFVYFFRMRRFRNLVFRKEMPRISSGNINSKQILKSIPNQYGIQETYINKTLQRSYVRKEIII